MNIVESVIIKREFDDFIDFEVEDLDISEFSFIELWLGFYITFDLN